jgi:hypothetical protein
MKIFDQHRAEVIIKTLQFEKETVNFEDIEKPQEIERLEIAFCNLTDLSGIIRFKNLREISIYYCRFLSDISLIGSLKSLEDIDLYALPKVENNFSFLELSKLERLKYTSVKNINSIKGIEKLTQLTFIGLSQVKIIDNDYSPIAQSKSLERVFWVGSAFQSPALQELRKQRPDIVIGGNAYNELYWAKKKNNE